MSIVNSRKRSPLLLVAKVGRVVGIHGDLKLHIVSDFPSIFAPQALFHTLYFDTLCIHSFDTTNQLVRFEGYHSRESANKLVNCELYSTLEESKVMCNLAEGEFLWEEIIGVSVYDKQENAELKLGEVEDIERIAGLDYLLIATESHLIYRGFSKQFFIPNISHYVLSLSPQGIFTHNAFEILKQS